MGIAIDCDSLKGHLAGICRGDYRKGNGGGYSLRERLGIIARKLRMNPDDVILPAGPDPVQSRTASSGIGDRLHGIIQRETGAAVPCSECKREIDKLNQSTIHEVRARANEIAGEIVKRAQTKAEKWWQRWGATLAPGFAKSRVLSWIEEACQVVHSPRTPFDRIKESANFVWIYWAGGAEADELRWSIRSVERNYAGIARITVIGDKPAWYTGHHIHQPRVDQQPFRPYRDTLSKIRTMITSPEITGEIVWCMDDCYFLKQGFTLADVATPKKNPRRGYRGSDDWSRMNRATESAIRARGLPYSSYVTHLPQVVDRERLLRVFAEFDFETIPLCWESCYGALFYPNATTHHKTLRRVQGRKVTSADCETAKASRVVLNHHHGSWGPELAQWLSEEFPE